MPTRMIDRMCPRPSVAAFYGVIALVAHACSDRDTTPSRANPRAAPDASSASSVSTDSAPDRGPTALAPRVQHDSPDASAPTVPLGRSSIDETGPQNPAGLSAADVADLMSGGPTDGKKWLYPYDGTVFLRGTIAPVLLWETDPAADAFYLHIESKSFEYKGALPVTLGAATPGSPVASFSSNLRASISGSLPIVQIPQPIWVQAGLHSQGKSDAFTIEVTQRANGKISGPFTTHIIIAQGSAIGSVYYSNYSDVDSGGGVAGFTGKIMRIPAGGTAEAVLTAPPAPPTVAQPMCPGCHSVAANGSRLLVQWADRAQHCEGDSYSMSAPPGMLTANRVSPLVAYSALYPDGSTYLTSTYLAGAGSVTAYLPIGQLLSEVNSTLHDSLTGEVLPDTGIPMQVSMPMFAPDGKHLVFNDYDIDQFHGLAVMDYDVTQHKANNYRVVVREDDPSGALRPGWPAFLPDDRAVVFTQTTSIDFSSGYQGGLSSTATAAVGNTSITGTSGTSDLYLVDLKTGTKSLLAKAMGFDSQADADRGNSYLPFGASELHNNFGPTVLPVAQGGYFWVFFDSLRNFGHLGLQRQLWAAAIDVLPEGADYIEDHSHPPFYLGGQLFGVANHRAFAALDACREQGATCTSGIDCCPGTTCYFPHGDATDEFGAPTGTCQPPPEQSCAALNERCGGSDVCCDSTHECINGICAYVDLQ